MNLARKEAGTIDQNTEALLQNKLSQVHGMHMGYRITQSMKSLAKAHGSDRLEEACAYALNNKISKVADLRAILDKRLDKLLTQDNPNPAATSN